MTSVFLILTSLLVLGTVNVHASIGDRSPFYQKCLNKCLTLNCTDDGLDFQNSDAQSFILRATFWFCEDECRYDCMWTTVHSFMLRSWEVPQFYGKWPFVRILGIQEPASVIFSIMNFAAHFVMLRRFRRDIRKDYPLYRLWHCYAAVSFNAWFWSAVFHARDFPLTEKMDYFCAFSTVLFSFFAMMVRFLYRKSNIAIVALFVMCVALFVYHITYLSTHFDYGYNMQANIMVGVATALGWLAWANYNRRRQPYAWRCVVFVLLAGVCMLFEVADFPPALWLVDAHSLWHGGTIFLPYFFYRFLIDDCKYLKREIEMEDSPYYENLKGKYH